MNRSADTKTSLRIALQKDGRLTDKTINLLEGIGLRFDNYKRSLMVKCRNFDVELLLIRDDDIPEYVQDGVCDLGFVGANVTAEMGADVTILRGLDYGVCRLSLAARKGGKIQNVQDFDGKTIATSYPNLTRNYLKRKGVESKIVTISGAVEIAPRLEVADAICDLVSTGNTLKANGLEEIETIFESETQLIQTNKKLSDGKKQLIDKFQQRIDGHQQAERSRYIMMNAPKDAVPKIKDIIPSLKSPTVMPLADEDMAAIHTVIQVEQFWDLMEKLKAEGASGIVILPIESMIA
ncbi:ATP phosphoribosyltransferase [Aliifodinibius sp. S!AR15-10]|uniref:ATP phosphoribosyltransferase n=1 Tax=Aliifodinibius sp. S!AR15-10 TaxID=2950437 RepID=UPI00285B1D72|nr:ATP phosphoribosyltransferase [Aliifodinibius sp. S!AR15-10]MDR8394475.1 ATP phosphoribosyltransferase [Aliifodinibius sp. S!AR15-10]